jgi:hypothetical protein
LHRDVDVEARSAAAAAADVDIPITPETKKALEAVTFIAAHLKNEDDYSEILDDWRYVASVIDRLQLYLFLAIIIAGTVGILIHAPHIFDFVDQDKIIEQLERSSDGYPNPDTCEGCSQSDSFGWHQP